jgi:hypothetical protein
LQIAADQPQHPLVRHTLGQSVHQDVVVDPIEGTLDTLPISKSFRRQCGSFAEAMPLKGRNSRCSGAASGLASCICC